MAVILVTHDLGVIAGRADRAAVMYAGKVMETTATMRLFANPRHPYTEALFGALPEKAADETERLYTIPGMPPDLTAPPPGCRFAARCRYVQDSCRADRAAAGGRRLGSRVPVLLPGRQGRRGHGRRRSLQVRPRCACERRERAASHGDGQQALLGSTGW